MKFFVLLIILFSIRYVYLEEETNYRLPSTVIPSHYELALTFARTVFSGERTTFDASVSIHLTVTELVSQIKLHVNAEYIRIKEISFTLGSADVSSYAIENFTEILTVSTKADLVPNVEYTLKITYEADINTSNMVGVFRTNYLDANEPKYMVAARLQPTYARRAFPCFDEPAFKATFRITFTLGPNILPLSNTEIERTNTITSSIIQYIFQQTPIMSTFTLAFVISDLTCEEAFNTDVNAVQNIICSRPAASLLRSYAVELVPKILDSMNNYTQVNYNEVMNKSHYIALPNAGFEFMENWGLSMYREQYLLYDPLISTNFDKQNIAVAIAQDVVKQWFGNLVTSDWWSEMFLNKGFADYLKYSILSSVLPEWELDKQYVVHNIQNVLRAEERYSRALLRSSVSTPLEIQLTLNKVSAQKAGGIFRMVEHIMGSDNFRAGINQYLTINKLGTITPDKLWNSLQTAVVSSLPSEETLATVMENWINNFGFPLISVTIEGRNVTITQEKLSDETDSSEGWYVPINYVTSLDVLSTNSTNPQHWLSPNGILSFEIPDGAKWFLVNYQQTGYYRVNYDIETWNSIETALKSPEFDGIDEISRAQLVDDLFSLARNEILSYSRVLKLLEFLAEDTSYFTWTAAFNGFGSLLNSIRFDYELTEDIKSYVLNLISKLYQSTHFDDSQEDDHIFTLKRELSLKWACHLGHLECIGMSRGLFLAYKLYSTRPPKELRSTVYCTALQQSDNDEGWTMLWNDYINSDLDSERILLLKSLACTTSSDILKELLQVTLLESIRAEDRLLVFENIATNPNGSAAAIDFFINNYQTISEKYQGHNVIPNILGTLADIVTNEEELEKLQTFVDGDVLPTEIVKEGNKILENVQTKIRRVTLYQQSINEYFHPNQSSAATTIFQNFIIFLIVSVVYLF